MHKSHQVEHSTQWGHQKQSHNQNCLADFSVDGGESIIHKYKYYLYKHCLIYCLIGRKDDIKSVICKPRDDWSGSNIWAADFM